MLKNEEPWKTVLGIAFIKIFSFVTLMTISLFSSYFNWFPALAVLSLLGGFVIILFLIPTLLNLSRSYFMINILLLLVYVLVTILSYGLYYKSAGLINNSVQFEPNLYEAIYFSVTTFTTLGYGDFQPTPSMRLMTSVEALTGMASMALGASLMWLWCQEHLIPKEMAFLDGNRRHKKSLDTSRMRVKTLAGKKRKLPKWVMPFYDNEKVTYDPELKEWIKLTEEENDSER